MSNKLIILLGTSRSVVLDVEEELARRTRSLLVVTSFAIQNFVSRVVDAAFDVVIVTTDSAFMLLRQGMITALGNPSTQVNPTDYAAGFADGQLGMVPARSKKVTK